LSHICDIYIHRLNGIDSLTVYLATPTPEEMAYEEHVMWDIVREMGGEEVDKSVRKIWEDSMDFFIIVSFLQRVLKLGGGWSPILHCESLPHSFEIAKTIPEFFNGFIDKGLVLNAPHNFQIIPLSTDMALTLSCCSFTIGFCRIRK
jgi:hypothetical protein